MGGLVPVLLRNLDIPIFIEIGSGLIRRLKPIISNYNLNFSYPLFLFGKRTYQISGAPAVREFTHYEIEYVGPSREEEVRRIEGLITERLHDVVIGIGGGRVLDVAKLAAARKNVGFISVPTIPSNDGIASPVAVIENGGENQSIRARVPMGIVVDIDLFHIAPTRQLKAGIGDLIANISALHDWRLAFDDGRDNFDPFAAMLSRLAVEGLIKFENPDLKDHGFIERLVIGLILSGIAMGIAGSSRPASGSEHEISHAIDHLFGGRGLHGEQVAITTLFTLHLQKQPTDRIRAIYERVAMPKRIDAIGLSIDNFVQAVQYAPKTRPGRYTILEKLNLSRDEIRTVALESGIWSGSR